MPVLIFRLTFYAMRRDQAILFLFTNCVRIANERKKKKIVFRKAEKIPPCRRLLLGQDNATTYIVNHRQKSICKLIAHNNRFIHVIY